MSDYRFYLLRFSESATEEEALKKVLRVKTRTSKSVYSKSKVATMISLARW